MKIENPTLNTIESNTVADSYEALFALKFKQDVDGGKLSIVSLDTDEKIKEAILFKFRNHPKISEASLDGVIAELKKSGVIKEPEVVAPPKKEKEIVVPEHFALPKLKGLEIVEDEEIKEIFRTNEERIKERALVKAEQDAVFDNEEEFNELYEGALKLEKNREEETDEYYRGFLNLNEKYSAEQIEKDLASLHAIEDVFAKQDEENGVTDVQLKTKKIATMAEIAIAYGFSEAGWAGDNVKVKATSRFDDIKRHTDELMEIEEGGGQSNFLGLGIDVTFQSLRGEDYKRKVFKHLKSIKDGFKTKVKFVKNSKGKLMPEFVVPNVILHINIVEVKKMGYLMKNIEDPKIVEKYKNSPQKFDTMNQIIMSCEKFGAFADKYENDISRNYKKALQSFEKLALSNPEIKAMLAIKHNDKTLTRLDQLIEEFERLDGDGQDIEIKKVA